MSPHWYGLFESNSMGPHSKLNEPELVEVHFRVAALKTDIPLQMSAIWGRAEVRGDTAEQPLLAKSRLTALGNSNRNVAHRDAGGGSRPQHQERSFGLPRRGVGENP